MPENPVGLFLFVLFLTPGLAYTIIRRRRLPDSEFSTLRETALLVAISVACNAVAVLFIFAARQVVPGITPHLPKLLFSSSTYVPAHLGLVTIWLFGFVALASGVGGLLGLVGTQGGIPIRYVSAWWTAFEGVPSGHSVYCGCWLEGGSWVGGYLSSYNTDVKETADRELILTNTLKYQDPSGEAGALDDVSSVIVSARRLVQLSVAYVPTPDDPSFE